MEIRKANKKDITFIEKILKNNDLPYEDVHLKAACFFLGHAQSRVIGIGGMEIYGEYGLLRSLVVDKPFREKGYGRELCFKLIEYAKSNGVREIFLLTTTAKNFFKKLGFNDVDRITAPSVIQNTTEFKDLCPLSASCMNMKIW